MFVNSHRFFSLQKQNGLRSLFSRHNQFIKNELSNVQKFSLATTSRTTKLSTKIAEYYRKLRYPTSSDLYARDGLNRIRYRLIYRSHQNRLLIWAVSCGSLALGPLMIAGVVKDLLYGRNMNKNDLDDNKNFIYYLTAGYLIVCAYLVKTVQRYVVRMYYDPSRKHFVLVTNNILKPWKTTKTFCKAGSASEISSMFIYFSNTKIDNRSWILSSTHFSYPIYCNVLYGYETPEALDRFQDPGDADAVFRIKKALDNE